jgi:hypothetical protein
MVEGEELGTIARRVIDSNQFMTIGTADEEGVPWVSPVWYAPAEYREFFWVSDPEARHSRNIAARPQVAIVIFDSHESGGWKAVYVFLSRREAGIDTGQWPLVTYVPDVGTAMTQARQAAGDKNVLVHGAGTAQLALAAGILDELEIHLIPVLLGQGRRLFDHLGSEHIDLERARVLEGDGVTHMHYRVRR